MKGAARAWLARHGPDLGLIGVLVAVAASLVTVMAYSGADGERYSPLNHTVSELGERGVSELAAVFDLGLIVGGVSIGLYMVSITLRGSSWSERGFGLLGLVASVAMVLVGLFPVDDLEPHVRAATMAFLLILVVAAWFAVWCLRGSAPYPAVYGWLAVAIVVLVIVFLLLTGLVQPDYHFEMEFNEELPRPDVLLNSLLEWIVIAAAWAWIAALAMYDRGHRTRGHP